MQVLELGIYTLLLTILLSLVFFPPGRITIEKLAPDLPLRLKQLSSFGLSYLLYAAIVALGLHYGISNNTLSTILICFCAISLSAWIYLKYYLNDFTPELRIGFSLVYLYLFLATLAVAFPVGNLRDISWDQTIHLSTLPVDSVIPYNVSRYIIERLDPDKLEVVPSWKMSDRGPLAGISNAVIFLMLGLEENARWVTSTPGLYFVYSVVISFANLLSIFAVLLIGWEWFGRKGALCSVLLLTSSYFFFLNTFFTWPKFFMAYFVLTAIAVWLARKNWVLTAILFAGASLSHNSALFSVCAFGLLCALHALFIASRNGKLLESIYSLAIFAGTYILMLSPWMAFKRLIAEPSPRLLYMHAFCILDADADKLSLGEAFNVYLSKNSLSEIMLTKAINIIYPFDVSWVVELLSPWRGIIYFLYSISHLVFFQLYLGVGAVVFLMALLALFKARNTRTFTPLAFSLSVCVGAVVFLALASGCRYNTVNHQWAYQAFLAIALAAGWYLSKGRYLAWSLATLAIASNVSLGIAYIWYRPNLKPFLHAGEIYTLSLAGLLACYLLYLLSLSARS